MLKIEPRGDFIFTLPDGIEFLKISADGVCTVQGEVVEENSLVWDAFKEWLDKSNAKAGQ